MPPPCTHATGHHTPPPCTHATDHHTTPPCTFSTGHHALPPCTHATSHHTPPLCTHATGHHAPPPCTYSTSHHAPVISTCLSLLFSNLRQLIRASSHKAKPVPSMEKAVHQEEKPVGVFRFSGEQRVHRRGLSSDDNESLSEISLVDGHYVEQEKKCASEEQDLLAEFLLDLLLAKRDFMDILSEI
ncbi:hypothetical protein ABZP36_011493, partial [Zizania latifolia]